MLKCLSFLLAIFSFGGAALAQNDSLPIKMSEGGAVLSSMWLLAIILLVIGFSFYLIFDRSSSYNRQLLQNSKDINRIRADEVRVYFLYLGFIVPSSEIAIDYFGLRRDSELISNLIAGAGFLLLFFLSGRYLIIRKYLYVILISFFMFFSANTAYKLLVHSFEMIHFAEWMLVSFFSAYLFQNIRYYWLYSGINICFTIAMFGNPNVSLQTASLFLIMGLMILLLNHARHLMFIHSREKLIFTNTIVNQGKSLVISSDKGGRINFISDNVREILGYEPEELLGNGWWDKTIDDQTEHANEREKIINLYINEEISTRMIRTAKGDYKWIQWYDKRLNDNLIVGIGQDITALKQLEIKQQERIERVERQHQIINELSQIQFKQKRSLTDQIKNILQMAAEGMPVDRIGFWEYQNGGMNCRHLYVKETMSFRKGEYIDEKKFPNYFRSIKNGNIIHAPDVQAHPDMQEFLENYVSDNGIRSSYDLPIFVGSQFKMVFCVETIREHYTWDADDQAFIKAISDVILIAVENQKRKEAEDRVHESENNFRLINETINSVFWLYHIEKDYIIYISPSCERIFGVSEDVFYSTNDFWKNYVLDEDKKIILQAHQEIMEHGSYEIEFRIMVEGELRWIKEQSYAIYDDRGMIIKSSGISSDISSEKKLREEVEQLSLVAQKTTNGVLITDGEAKVIWANEGFLDLMEIKLDELIGKRPRDLFLRPDHNNSEIEHKLNEHNFNLELEIRTFKGNTRWIAINNTSILDDYGKLIQQIELITDVTDRVKTSLQLAEQSEQLGVYARELEFQNTLKELLMQNRNIQDITLNALAFIFVQFENAHHIALLFPDDKSEWLSGYFLEHEELAREEFHVSGVVSYEVCKQGEIYIKHDLDREELSDSDKENLKSGVKSYIALPLHYQKTFLGQLLLGFSEPFALDESQIGMLRESCQIIAISIHHLNLQQNLQLKTDDLLASISYAQHIQQSILPDLRTFSKHITQVSLLYQPKDLVSGDFYWAKEIGDYSFLAIADCTGHGVPGAFLTLLGMNMLEQLIGIEKIYDPSQVLRKLDRRMFNTLNSGSTNSLINDGMEIALCVYDKRKQELTYSGAGLGVLYFKDGEEKHVRGQRVSIADLREGEFEFENTIVPISGDEYFFMATDGYQDQLGGERLKRFSKNKLIELLNKNKELPPDQQEKTWIDTMSNYMQQYPQIDDFTVIGFTIKP